MHADGYMTWAVYLKKYGRISNVVITFGNGEVTGSIRALDNRYELRTGPGGLKLISDPYHGMEKGII